ncbi:MAG: hypothetical protein IJL91_03775 [Bacteroidales bacterium]|nr:hypothetical protein [Bacteroidales bacterium]
MDSYLQEARIASHHGQFLPVFARKCRVERIPKAIAEAFLSSFHIMGSTSCRYAYGLILSADDEEGEEPDELLVAVSTFSGARNIPVETSEGTKTIRSFEWVRYASLPDMRVIGGMGKTLKCFIDEVRPDDVMSYALEEKWKRKALEKGDPGVKPIGDAYLKLGFVKEGEKIFPGGKKSIKFRLKLTY